MFQPDLQLYSLISHPNASSPSFSRRSERSATADRSEATLAQLKKNLCAEISPNKRAMVEQLIKRWSQGNLD